MPDGVLSGLCWTSNWVSNVLSRRRFGFPSWSWTEWYGEFDWDIWGAYTPNLKIYPSLNVCFMLLDGTVKECGSMIKNPLAVSY
jgi:hypothetical protein